MNSASHLRASWFLAFASGLFGLLPAIDHTAAAQAAQSGRDIVMRFSAADGTPLEAKLSLPASTAHAVPVVFMLHGAGPRNFDHPVRSRAADGSIQTDAYYDYYARELNKRGLAFFRMSKRGCTVDSLGRSAVNRTVFMEARPGVLVEDYITALKALRGRAEIDTNRLVLMGTSEGTRLAPQVANREPNGIVGLVLMSYQADNVHDTVVWQNTVGPWRNVKRMIVAARDDVLTRLEYEEARSKDASLAQRLPFDAIDVNKDSTVGPAELQLLLKPRLDALMQAVEQRNDELIWQAMGNVSSGYLIDDWDGAPTRDLLLKLDVRLAIFHGELDGTTRVEGVIETEAAFKAAGKVNLTARVYRELDHDLNWTPATARGGQLEAFSDAFDASASFVRGAANSRK